MAQITGQQEHQELLQDAATGTGDGNEMNVEHYSSITTQNIGTWTSATVTFEGTIDRTTYTVVQGTLVSDGTFATTSSTTDEYRRFDVSGFVGFRARISAHSSGDITVSARATPVSGGGASSPASVDLNEPIDINGTDANGASVTGKPVLIAGLDSAAEATTMMVSAAGRVVVAKNETTADGETNSAARLVTDNSAGEFPLEVVNMDFNDTTWDRHRNNQEITLLASAARTVQTDSADFTNFNGKGILITLDFSIEADTVTLTPAIVVVDNVTGSEEFEIWSAAAGVTAIGNTSYLLYPGVLDADFDGTEAVSIALPRTFFLRMKVGDGSSATYSVGATLIN